MKKLAFLVSWLILTVQAWSATLPLVGGSAKIGPDGRSLSIQFSAAAPSSWSNPTTTGAKPTLSNGTRSVQPAAIGAWYVNSGGVLTWTAVFDIPPEYRANYGETWTVSWTAALATDQDSNTTPTTGTAVAVVNGSKTDSTGWYAVPASADSRSIYVDSATGVDSNPGTQALPKATMAGGASLMRAGFPDRMYVGRGGTYTWPWTNWTMSGRGPNEPICVMAYGSGARPIISAGTGRGFNREEAGPNRNNPTRYVTITGLDFRQSSTLGTDIGLWWLGGGHNVWFEDCRWAGFSFGGTVQEWQGQRIEDFTMRRCVVVNSTASGTGHSSGFYGTGMDRPTFSENIFDQNGYNNSSFTTGNQQNHNIYLSTQNTDVVFWENITTRASSDGVKIRSGGVIYGNLVYECPIGIKSGWDDADDAAPLGSGRTLIAKNVVLAGSALLPSLALGWDINVMNGIGGGVFDNIVANNSSTSNAFGLRLDGTAFNIGFNKFDVRGNILYQTGGGGTAVLIFSGSASQLSGVTLANNVLYDTSGELLIYHSQTPVAGQFVNVANNSIDGTGGYSFGGTSRSFAQWKTGVGDSTSNNTIPSYAATNRTPASYNGVLGGTATKAAWYTAILAQRNGNWTDNLGARATNAYFRAGFSVTSGTVPSAPVGLAGAKTSTTATVSFPAVANATEYKIRRLDGTGGSVASSQTVTDPTATFTSLTASTTYYFNALATNATGDSSASAELAVRTAPAVITGLGATAQDAYVALAWTESVDSAWRSYRIYTGASGSGPWSLFGTISSAKEVVTFQVPGTPLTAIHAYVTQVDSFGAESDASSVVNATPTVPAVNAAPIANAGADFTVTDTNRDGVEAVQLDGRASVDPDGSIVSYVWSEGGVTLATGSFPKITRGVAAHTLTLTVTDDDGATDTDTVTVTIAEGPAPNVAPTCSLPSFGDVRITTELATTTNISLDATAADSDGTLVSLYLSMDNEPIWDVQNDPDEVAAILLGFSQEVGLGAHTFFLRVTDDDGATCSSTGSITVLPYIDPDPNEAPVITAGTDQTITLARGTFTAAVTMAGVATDADGTISEVRWLEDTRTLKVTPTNGNNAQVLASSITLAVGRHVLTLKVTDDDAAITTDTVTIQVNPNRADQNNPLWIARFLRWIRSTGR